MLFANDYNDNRVYIDDTQSNQAYYCPFCGVPLIMKKGEMRQHHFAHSASHRCSDTWERNGGYDMSQWHNEWQSVFPKENQEVKLSLGEISHRADVLIDRTVVEFQHSVMQERAFDERNNFYFNLGYKVVWLFDLSDLFNNGEISRQGETGTDYCWHNPKKAFSSYDVKSGCIDLFFQLSETEIIRVLDVSQMGFEQFEASKAMSKEVFLNYVGLKNGRCALPSRDDREEKEKYEAFCKKYHISLNRQQERALQAVEGANLLLAVPGSGKTTVLVSRLGHMVINKGINPSSVLAITYNKNAAEEMNKRFSITFGAEIGNKITFSTINALCYSVYRRYCKEHNIREKTLLEGPARKGVLRAIIQKRTDDYPTENDVLELEQALGYIKNMMLSESELLELEKSFSNLSEMYHEYQETLDQNNNMDFDDQMVFALDILKSDHKILQELRAKYHYISVDEAQDTSKSQHTVIRMLADGNNLFMVGDEDQSIYGFRAAYPKALLNFRYDYINPFIMRMERNYRSTPQIVEKAQQFISKNKGRYEKHMTAERDNGEEVHLIPVNDREDQYSRLLEIAKNPLQETAFLYRDNESSVVLVDMLQREGIPFRLRRPEMNFFRTKVVLDIIAHLKLAVDDHDYASLERVCNKGILFLKRKQRDYAIKDCEFRKKSVFEALDKQMQYIEREYRDRAENFKRYIQSISSLSPKAALDSILEKGYRQYLEKNKYDSGKVELLKILANKESSIESFLARLQFLENSIQAGFETTEPCPIILSTIHSSKGLEYDTVYMVDVFDGRFPSSMPNIFNRSKDNSDGEQEERRLFYVGITRAKNSLNLFTIKQQKSAFIEELFPAVRAEREQEERPAKIAAQWQRQTWIQQQQLRLDESRRREAEARRRELEERQKKEEEEQAKRKAEEEQRCLADIIPIIDQQDNLAKDSQNRRWVRCESCGKIDLSDEFASYGGKNHINLGVCKECSRKNTNAYRQ